MQHDIMMKEILLQIRDLLKAQQIHQKEILSFKEATHYLDVSSSFLYKMTSNGKLRFTKPSGKLIYFLKEDLNNWMLQNPKEGVRVLLDNMNDAKNEL